MLALETGEIAEKAWTTNPVARHMACPVKANTPTVCKLQGDEESGMSMTYYILTLPAVGLLYETSPNFRAMGIEPVNAPDPIGPHQLPFQLTDPSNKVVYVPPYNQWPSENFWASFSYVVDSLIGPPLTQLGPPTPVMSEAGLVVVTNPEGKIVGSNFNLANGGDGWTLSGQLEVAGGNQPAAGLRHQALSWGGLNRYVYGVDEVQNLDFATGSDLAKWYFEASPATFHKLELAVSYGGYIGFTVRSQYGDFRELNHPLDWITIECESCDSGRGARIIRFVDGSFRWEGAEVRIEVPLNFTGRWSYDPLNSAAEFVLATECQIASVLNNVSRVAILGDFTKGGEGVAIDDVAIVSADASRQPAHPVQCQKGCVCRHSQALIRPTCC